MESFFVNCKEWCIKTIVFLNVVQYCCAKIIPGGGRGYRNGEEGWGGTWPLENRAGYIRFLGYKDPIQKRYHTLADPFGVGGYWKTIIPQGPWSAQNLVLFKINSHPKKKSTFLCFSSSHALESPYVLFVLSSMPFQISTISVILKKTQIVTILISSALKS